MSEFATEHHVHQLLVPAYVWHDKNQRAGVLAAMLRNIATQSANDGLQLKLDADGELVGEVTPNALTAVVGTAELPKGEVEFVAYERCALENADLVFIVVDAELEAKRT